MDFIVSKNVIEGNEILALIKNKETWVAISKEDNSEDIEFNEDNFGYVDKEYLTNRIPKLIGNLDQPHETIINIDYKTGEINFNKKHFHFGIPTHSARATRQANEEFSFIRWLGFNRFKYFKMIYWIIVLIVLGKIIGWFFFCLIPIPIILRYLIDSKTRDMYRSGALLPGIVINKEKGHIAVLTDLSLGIGSYPIIKIEKTPIPSSHNYINSKLAIAGAYQKNRRLSPLEFFRTIGFTLWNEAPKKALR